MNYKSRQEHKAKGLCCHCPEEAIPGRLRCQAHLDYERTKSERRRVGFKSKGFCPRCGSRLHEDMDADRTNCLNCREGLSRI